MIKKIWIFAAIFVVLMTGFSVFIIQISGYNTVYQDEQVAPKELPQEINMKCGEGKCGSAMVEESK